MKKIYLIQKLQRHLFGVKNQWNIEMNTMDLAIQRIQTNKDIMLFKTDYLEE